MGDNIAARPGAGTLTRLQHLILQTAGCGADRGALRIGLHELRSQRLALRHQLSGNGLLFGLDGIVAGVQFAVGKQ